MKHNHAMIKIQFPIQNFQTAKQLFFVEHIGSMEYQHPCVRPNGLEGYQILFCTSGEGHFIVDGKTYIISEGMGFYLYPNVPHEYFATTEPWTTYWVLFDGKGVDMIPFIHEKKDYRIFYITHREKLLFQHQELYSYAENGSLSNRNALSASCYHFLLEMDECCGEAPLSLHEINVNRMELVTAFLEKNYNQDITLEQISKIADITPQYLCRLFQTYYHMRPMEYVLRLRMREAKKLLLTNDQLSLNELSTMVGYHDTSYFCRMFKKLVGMTPGEFKNQR